MMELSMKQAEPLIWVRPYLPLWWVLGTCLPPDVMPFNNTYRPTRDWICLLGYILSHPDIPSSRLHLGLSTIFLRPPDNLGYTVLLHLCPTGSLEACMSWCLDSMKCSANATTSVFHWLLRSLFLVLHPEKAQSTWVCLCGCGQLSEWITYIRTVPGERLKCSHLEFCDLVLKQRRDKT